MFDKTYLALSYCLNLDPACSKGPIKIKYDKQEIDYTGSDKLQKKGIQKLLLKIHDL